MNEALIVERSGARLRLVLNRPERANALGPDLVEPLIAVLDADGLAATRLVTIEGAGKHFCSGFDLGDFDQVSEGDLVLRLLRIETLLQLVHHASCPVLALAQGRAIGAGADLFAACSIRIAAPGASFRMPGWRFGIALGTRRLVARIGADAARDFLVASRTMDAAEAQRLGLVTRIAEAAEWPEAIAEAERVAAVLDRRALAEMHALTAADTRAADMAALVATATRPGLKDRIARYREAERQAAGKARPTS